MKFYLSASAARASEIVARAEQLEALGHEITYDWARLEPSTENKEAAVSARVVGVQTAEVVVAMWDGSVDDVAETLFDLGVGYAHALTVKGRNWATVVVVGDVLPDSLVRSLPNSVVRQCVTWAEFIDCYRSNAACPRASVQSRS